MSEHASAFKPSLRLFDGTMIVAGSMIGSGIFIVSADITRNVGSAGWLIVVWLLTGFMTLIAAMSYGELSAMFPRAGGQYVYLKEAYNPVTGFVYGWSFFAVIQTGTIAAVGVAFSKFAAYLFPFLSETNYLLKWNTGVNSSGIPTYFTVSVAQVVAIVLIAFLTWTNTRGVKAGKWIQNIFTSTKILSLLGLIAAGVIYFKPEVWHGNWANAFAMKKLTEHAGVEGVAGAGILGAIAASMVGSIFSSDAWNNVTFIAGEMENPKRNVGLSLFLGTMIVTAIYVCANLMYVAVLPLHDVAFAEHDRVAVAAARAIFGNLGTYVIAIMIMISTFGCNNGLILSGARVYYSMGKDRLFFAKAATLNSRAVPEWALWAQFVVASLLCLSGRYGDLLDMISFVVVIFYVLTIGGIFILRKKRPDIERPYKAFGYPLLPALYMVMGTAFCILLIVYKPNFTWPGLIIALLGIPIYYIVASKKNNGNEERRL